MSRRCRCGRVGRSGDSGPFRHRAGRIGKSAPTIPAASARKAWQRRYSGGGSYFFRQGMSCRTPEAFPVERDHLAAIFAQAVIAPLTDALLDASYVQVADQHGRAKLLVSVVDDFANQQFFGIAAELNADLVKKQ